MYPRLAGMLIARYCCRYISTYPGASCRPRAYTVPAVQLRLGARDLPRDKLPEPAHAQAQVLEARGLLVIAPVVVAHARGAILDLLPVRAQPRDPAKSAADWLCSLGPGLLCCKGKQPAASWVVLSWWRSWIAWPGRLRYVKQTRSCHTWQYWRNVFGRRWI
jgi:hypothetical protein